MSHSSNRASLSLVDNVICSFDRALRSLTPRTQSMTRPCPQAQQASQVELNEQEKKHAAGLMRVNHSGEVCAQALYQGQALTAKLPKVRAEMEQAADEEIDHLAWCEQRLTALGSQPSVLNPMWYGLSFGIGATAGMISDKISLGFVAATEEQVCKHLSSHLDKLPKEDYASKAIVEQMIIDEKQHGTTALDAGGIVFPKAVKSSMTFISSAMTSLSYKL
ncbi:2-polyprenyl-3-methyl-6-methoxy-1,4-benzoquinone monooxygenase [Agarilytica rhodophyticola]|uniref:2-polyprenyl-3-methyl-6-methoxy-1,4-benzoquinone monooxygenase n=1 Tax=Agarilytica rhodophyticola TaxID=1737490 RepID=UPI000B3477FF|nr:2-polyprenyl-3-methyl-6-methoxy-1,4-benzoquinone monooxygenase [Agarilytica rhodophyticola]